MASYRITAVTVPTNAGTIYGTGLYEEGSSVALAATPNVGYKFIGWFETNSYPVYAGEDTFSSDSTWYSESEDQISDLNPLGFVADRNRSLTAKFEAVATCVVDVSINPVGCGTVSGAGLQEKGKDVTLTAFPNEGYVFSNWSNGLTDNPYVFTATDDISLVANFKEEEKVYTITVSSNDRSKGTVTGGGTFKDGDIVNLSATVLSDIYKFDCWKTSEIADPVSYSNPWTFVMGGDIIKGSQNIVGYFSVIPIKHNVTLLVNNPEMGTVFGAGDYQEGINVTISARPNEDFQFDGWYEHALLVSQNRTYEFKIESDRTFEARFSPKPVDPVELDIVTFDSTNVDIADVIKASFNYYDASGLYKFKWSTDNSDWVDWDTVSGSPTASLTVNNSFEEAMINTTSKKFYIRVEKYLSSVLYEYQQFDITVNVQEDFRPEVTLEDIVIDNTYNDKPIAGYSTFKVPYTVSNLAPSGYTNHATIKVTANTDRGECTVTDDYIEGSFTTSDDNYRSAISAKAVDSRDRSDLKSTDVIDVYGYYTPIVTAITSIKCNAEGVVDPVMSNNTYCKVDFTFDIAEVEDNTVLPENVVIIIDDKRYTSATVSGWVYSAIVGDGELDPNSDYQFSLNYHDNVMTALSLPNIVYTSTLNKNVVFSLYDDKQGNVGVSLGKEANTPNISLCRDIVVDTDMKMSASTYNSSSGAGALRVKELNTYELLDRGGINSVAVSDDDIASGIYANNIRVMTGEVYKQIEEPDENTLYFLSTVPEE